MVEIAPFRQAERVSVDGRVSPEFGRWLDATVRAIQDEFSPMTGVGALRVSMDDTEAGGWLACDGQALATADYPALFGLIGYTYGGSGANFNVPDYNTAAPAGQNWFVHR
jgi:hypothetical protein